MISVPLPWRNPSRCCSFGGHCTRMTSSWPAQTSSSDQSRTHWSSVVCLKWSKSDLYLFLWFLPFGCIFYLSFPWSCHGFASLTLSTYAYTGTEYLWHQFNIWWGLPWIHSQSCSLWSCHLQHLPTPWAPVPSILVEDEVFWCRHTDSTLLFSRRMNL